MKDIKNAFDNLPDDIVEYDDIVDALMDAGFTEDEIDDLIEAESIEEGEEDPGGEAPGGEAAEVIEPEGDEELGEITKEDLLAELRGAIEDGIIDSTDLSSLLQVGPVEKESVEDDLDDEGPIKGNSLAKLIAGFKV